MQVLQLLQMLTLFQLPIYMLAITRITVYSTVVLTLLYGVS